MASAKGNERGHALYAPSAAHRWMVCPASVKATANIPSTSSLYAAEGTVAHHVLESALNEQVDAAKFIGEIIDVEIEGKPSSLIVTKEMAEAVQVCLDYLRPFIEEADDWSAERRVTLALFGAVGCYGTSDFTAVISVAGRVLVVDYKHGAGIAVEVKNNPQLKIYALGTVLALGGSMKGITHVQTTIVQPRIPHVDGFERSWTYTIAELMDFGADVLAAIERAEADDAPYVPGEHCKWCGIENSCAARARAIAGDVVAVVSEMQDGMVLSIDEQERFLKRIEELGIEDFITSLRGALHKYVEDGGKLTSYKLVPKRPTRVWLKDADTIVNGSKIRELVLKKTGDLTDMYNMELKSPAQMEKIIGKGLEARTVLAGLTTSVSNGTNLVSIDDPRREAQVTAEDEFDSFTP